MNKKYCEGKGGAFKLGNWGISENANEKEKLKSKMADFLNGLNCCGDIDISTYDKIFDFSMDLLDEAYELGKSENSKIVNIDKVQSFDNRKSVK